MKVTGWTYWDNPNYIDIRQKAIEERIKIRTLKTFEEFKQMSREEWEAYEKEQDAAFEIYMKNSKIERILEEVEKTVIKEIKDKGYKFCGTSHQNGDFGVPIIDEKYVYQLSQREWGGLMAEVYPDDDYERYGKYRYIKWAWMNAEGAKYPNS